MKKKTIFHILLLVYWLLTPIIAHFETYILLEAPAGTEPLQEAIVQRPQTEVDVFRALLIKNWIELGLFTAGYFVGTRIK